MECAQLLLDAGADVNADSNSEKTPLHWAAVAHNNKLQSTRTAPANVDVIALLIERGADVDAQDSEGRTPLFHGCQGGYAVNAVFLIVLGANTTIRNRRGKSPLDVAAKDCLYMKTGNGDAR